MATSSNQPPTLWLYRYSLLLVFCTLLLILAGGLVTSHEAGLAVPDWPLSYGQLMPPMVGNIFWEHGHRMIAGMVGIMTLISALWIQIKMKCSRIKVLAWSAVGAVVLQALLGGLTVLLMLPPPVSIFHACLAQTFFCITVAMAYFLKPALATRTDSLKASPVWLSKLCKAAFAAIFIQLILGAIIRHTSQGVIFHVLWAFVVIAVLFWMTRAVMLTVPERRGAVRAASVISLLVIAQFFLGLGAFVYTQVLARGYAPQSTEVFFASAHHTNGALLLGLCMLVCLQVRK